MHEDEKCRLELPDSFFFFFFFFSRVEMGMFLKIVIGIDCEEIIPVNRRGNDIAIDTRNVDTGVKSTRSSQSYESSSITGIAILPIQTSRHELPFKIRFHYV